MTPNYPEEMLVLTDFVTTPNTQTGLMETVLEHVVPRNEARMLLRSPGRLHFGTRHVTAEGDGIVTSYALPVTLVRSRNFPVPAIVLIYDGADPDSDTLVDTLVYVASAPAAGQFTLSANNVVLGDAADLDAGEFGVVYFPFGNGEYTVEVFSPNERTHDTYANGTILRLNSAPQDDVNSVWALGSNTPPLPQDTIVRVQVKITDADAIVNFDAVNVYTAIELPFTRLPVGSLNDPDAYLDKLGA